MSSGVETVEIIDTWLWTVLSSDATLMGLVGGTDSLVGTLAQGSVPTPYVVYFMSSARDVVTVPHIRVAVDALYTVKTVGIGPSWSTVTPIFRRVDELLNGANVTTPNGYVSCIRETVIQYAEVTQGTQYRHLGGIFRVRAHSD